jgi:hypothetical protein
LTADPLSSQEQEDILLQLFAECLEVPEVSLDDDFFLLGGYSLAATKLAARIRSVLGVAATVTDIFRNPTPRKLVIAMRDLAAVPLLIQPLRDGRVPPASFAQERLWILDQFGGPSNLYNVPLVFRLRGRLEIEVLRLAITDLLDRHPPLRTRMALSDSGLRQEVISAQRAPALRFTDGLPPDAVESAVRSAAGEPFDLGSEIPFRAHLFRYGDDYHVLLLLIHHIAIDGWSNNPLSRDLGHAYSERLAGRPVRWRRLAVQYGDYAAWQRDVFDAENPSETASEQAQFWRSALQGVPELMRIDTDRPRPPSLSSRGDQVPVTIDHGRHESLLSASRSAGLTVFTLVHAAFSLLMHARGGGVDIVVGATAAGRPEAALDDLVGLFVNTLVLRVDLSGDPTMAEVVRRAHSASLAAMKHQDLPFDRVVELVNPPRSAAHNPVVQTLLAFQVGTIEAPKMAGLETAVEILMLKVAKFDLTLELTECFDESGRPNGIKGHLEFSEDLFDRTTVHGMVQDLNRLLRIMTEQPDKRIGQLCLGSG